MKHKLREAWQLRLEQSWEPLRIMMANLKVELAVPTGSLQPAKVSEILANSSQAESVAELLLLHASLLRAEGALESARQLHDAISAFVYERGVEPSFQLLLQKGLNEVASGDLSSALECFLASRSMAQDLDRLVATTNVVLCLYDLGLPFVETLREVQENLALTPPSPAKERLRSQIEVLQFKHDLQHGEFEKLNLVAKKTPVGQIDYLRAWLTMLPYHSFYQPLRQFENLLLANPYFHQKQYRIRTLQGISHPKDLQEIDSSELVDRIYLWTWRWLTNPQALPVQKVLDQIAALELRHISLKLTNEDYHLLKNAAAWISLFDQSDSERIDRLIMQFRPLQAQPLPLWALESRVIDFCFALRDRDNIHADGILQQLRQNPLWTSSFIYWPPLIDALSAEKNNAPLPAEMLPAGMLSAEMQTLLANLQHLKTPSAQDDCEVTVDLAKETTTSKHSLQKLRSRPVARALDLLAQRESVGCGEFLLVSFEMSGYDSLYHDQKIFNLLSRLRSICPPEFRFGVKAGRVFGTGDWTKVRFIQGVEPARQLIKTEAWQKQLALRMKSRKNSKDHKQKWLKPNLLMRRLSEKKTFTREDVELLAGTSRASANRLLSVWFKEGLIEKNGTARNTNYTFKNVAQR